MTKQFKVGDKVRVIGSPNGDHHKWDSSEGFYNVWSNCMDETIGTVFEIVNISKHGIELYSGYRYPPQALELVESAEVETQEQTFTLDEIENAYYIMDTYHNEFSFDILKKKLLYVSDPEYNTYLRLKEKFEC